MLKLHSQHWQYNSRLHRIDPLERTNLFQWDFFLASSVHSFVKNFTTFSQSIIHAVLLATYLQNYKKLFCQQGNSPQLKSKSLKYRYRTFKKMSKTMYHRYYWWFVEWLNAMVILVAGTHQVAKSQQFRKCEW